MTATRMWRPVNLPAAGSRTDDIWFADALNGWAVNSDGLILRTADGGDAWTRQAHLAESYLRCVSFAGRDIGWVGALSGPNRLYATRNGGLDWSAVTSLPSGAPGRICGVCAVDEQTVFASGTNYPNEDAAILRSRDAGQTWQVLDVPGAALLVDIFFESPQRGWVVGGVDNVRHPDRAPVRADIVPGVFHTDDGGETWTNLVQSNAAAGEFPRGEWGWKFQKLNDRVLFVSCENFLDGAILRSDDGGLTWSRLRVNDSQRNSNLEGIGFLDEQHGWIGGWGDRMFVGGFTSVTEDGGKNWQAANDVGFRLNRFRFIGSPPAIAYASGDTVYKYSDEPVAPSIAAIAATSRRETIGENEVVLETVVPVGCKLFQVRVWERFGREVAMLADERNPQAGPRNLLWDFSDRTGARQPPGGFIVRFTCDDESTSQLIYRERRK
ncbi:hypothetical protein MesoLjLc_02250 [Mesorhizobium sp. L-8-10]|uniref:WD40/YVTN/BNR-like repeat-containing protein n=1 Tax=Mesorhizobium sp. L-8-10 TaxID=2744523 RepID=UPI001926FCA2|nr:YCF48-related protein [Mesorhizobium sp. L-8-10]BCH28295.1 hypothetical protein MesoLjLc_02250 [Mesorhizobium sp. L-8-10]